MTLKPTAIILGVLALIPGSAARGQADTVPPAGVIEQPLTFQSGALELAGTLTLPDGIEQPPIAIIIAGSGPTDRNGNQGARLRTNTYAQLAWGLAGHGIASLRYDKRVLPTTKGQISLPDISFGDFVADAGAAANAVRADHSKVFLVGHSEGGTIAIDAAANGLPVDGVVLISTPGRGMTTLLHEQLARQLDSATLVQFDTALERFLRGEEPGELPVALRPLVAPVNRTFMQGWAAVDPQAEVARIEAPVLIVQGDKDIQVRLWDAEALKAAKTDATLFIVPGATHTLKAATDTLLGAQLGSYTDPTLPLVTGVVDSIAAFIKR